MLGNVHIIVYFLASPYCLELDTKTRSVDPLRLLRTEFDVTQSEEPRPRARREMTGLPN